MSEFEDEYSESLDTEFRKLQGALLEDTVRLLAPSEPLRLTAEHSVARAIQAMVQNRRAAVVIVDDADRLIGIFTERDVLTRVAGKGRDPRQTTLGAVMTREPDALGPDDRVAYAVHSMSVAGYRTVPLVDAERRPLGVVTVSDVIRWLAGLFPEAILNLPPADRLKRPHEIDAG